MVLAACLLLAIGPWFWAVGRHPIVSLEGEIAAWLGWLLLALWALWRKQVSSVIRSWSNLPLVGLALLILVALADLMTGRNPYIAQPLIVIGYLLGGGLVFSGAHRLAGDVDVALLLIQRVAAFWLMAGLLCVAIGGWQYLRPEGIWPWIAPLNDVGRVYANLRQPNHLATMLAMAWVCLIWLSLERGQIRPVLTLSAGAALVAGIAMTGSRTGVIILIVCVAAVAFQYRFRRSTAWLMGLFLGIYAMAWLLLLLINDSGLYGSFGVERLKQLTEVQDVSGSRFGVWRSTLDIIAAYPLAGVGTGRFAYAYILGEWTQPATLQFTHAHNLFLHLAAEHGLPLLLSLIGLIGYFLYKCWRCGHGQGTWWWAWVFPLPVVVHSMFELPLWYTYFLFPVLFSLGLLGGAGQHVLRGTAEPVGHESALLSLTVKVMAFLLWLSPLLIWRAQQETHELYVAQEKPFFERLQLAQNAFWLRQYADHALLNSAPLELVLDQRAAMLFPAVGQVLLDAKLLRSWAMNCAAQGGGQQATRLAYAAMLISQQDFERWRVLVLELEEPKLEDLQSYLRQPRPVRLRGDDPVRQSFCGLPTW